MTVTDQIVEKVREVAKQYAYDHLPAPLIKLMLESVAQDLVPESWQPIETAPKDNLAILAWEPVLQNIWLVVWRPDLEAWTHLVDGQICHGITKWCQLPPPPTSQGTGGPSK